MMSIPVENHKLSAEKDMPNTTWRDLVQQWSTHYSTEMHNRLLLVYEPPAEDLERFPWLDGLGGVIKDGRGHLTIYYCEVYNKWRSSQVALYLCDQGLAEVMDSVMELEERDRNIRILKEVKRQATVNFVGNLLTLTIVTEQKLGQKIGMGGALFNEINDVFCEKCTA